MEKRIRQKLLNLDVEKAELQLKHVEKKAHFVKQTVVLAQKSHPESLDHKLDPVDNLFGTAGFHPA